MLTEQSHNLIGPSRLKKSFRSPTRSGIENEHRGLHTTATTAQASSDKQWRECNKAGLNGLRGSGLDGLETGSFTVEAWMPMRYNVELVQGIFDLENTTLLRCVDTSNYPASLSMSTSIPAGQTRRRRLLLVDENVLELYGQKIKSYFHHHSVEVFIHSVQPDEQNKSMEQVVAICASLQRFNIDRRNEPIIAIGGGVTLDIAGLAANMYRRNTPVIKIPTTLIGMVDAAVGVKTAVNLQQGKNKMGTYCAPLAVFVDTGFLATLTQRHIQNGAAEILKMACIKDAELFRILENFAIDLTASGCDESKVRALYSDVKALPILKRAIQGMLEELEPNLWEFNLRRIVDYGHTFSPPLEMAALSTDSPLLHGEAVCIDMAFTTILAQRRNLISRQDCQRVLALMRNLGLDIFHPSFTPALMRRALTEVVAGRGGFQHVPLMHGIGKTYFADDLTETECVKALEELEALSKDL